ncbi:hypothetical protein L7F22_045571 [Adiantum nelumboides]|nr:hypothetical protein [Adiantum nelumboides]
MTLALPEGWRGLAHFQLESRRNVLKKCSERRTFNELYMLEEFALNVKFICNLPFSKRLEVCKLFKYVQAEANSVVYKVGDLATSLYIIFTGSIKVITGGKRGHDYFFLRAGDCFGEAALENEDCYRTETVVAQDKCELIVLNKEDFTGVLKNEVSKEVKDKMEVLKYIKVLRGISDHSIQRLAKLLVPRTFAKNRVIAFQGEEAMEMFFMKSGECRVVMEVQKDLQYAPRPPPQVALRSCRLSNLSSKPQLTGHQVRPLVENHCFDLRYTVEPFSKQHDDAVQIKYAMGSRSCSRHGTFNPFGRPSLQLSEDYGDSLEGGHMVHSFQQMRSNQHASSCLSFASMATGSDLDPRDNVKGHGQRRQTLQADKPVRNQKTSYTLKSFLKDFEKRGSCEDHIPDLGFSDKQALAWNTGTNLTGMLRGDISDAAVYQKKFESWVRRVITRERRVHAEAAIDHGLAQDISKDFLWSPWPMGSKRSGIPEDTVFLDVGALSAGDFFGEIGLLHHFPRKASILTVTTVEVLVLSKWDFNRQVDRDIVECLSANDYKKIDYIFQQYQKTCRWALYKKKLMQEVLAVRRQRFPNLYEHDMCRGMPCTRYTKRE